MRARKHAAAFWDMGDAQLYDRLGRGLIDRLAEEMHCRALWQQLGFWLAEAAGDRPKSPELLCEHVADLLAYFA